MWCHPLEVHYSTSSIQGWPQVSLQVWRQDKYGRAQVGASAAAVYTHAALLTAPLLLSVGYGCTRMPVVPGMHELEVVTWAPEGSWMERVAGAWRRRVPNPGALAPLLASHKWAVAVPVVSPLAASLIGATPQLKHPKIVTDTETDRCELQAGTRGVVHLEVQVLAKGFAEHGVSFNDTPSGSVGRKNVD